MSQKKRPRLSAEGAFRFMTSPIRVLPDFLVIGAMKSGTTSLFHYLSRHPRIEPALVKEVSYFSLENPFWRNGLWYRAHFPTRIARYLAKRTGKKMLTFEATPGYLFHPLAPKRMWATVPKAKLILLLRNPVDRCYSNYQNVVRSKVETLRFEEALERERETYLGRYTADLKYLTYSYLGRSTYITQLENLLQYFPPDQLLILDSRELETDTGAVLNRVFDFLEVPSAEYPGPGRFTRHEDFDYPPMRADTRQELVDYFRPYNQRLYELLGKDFGWERE